MSAPGLTSGTRLGPYEIVERLGAGGMGEVYKARDTRLGRTVALKVLAPGIAGDESLRARFEREARAVATLDHPHICGIYDVGDTNGTRYFVMPCLEGQTLATRLAEGPLPLDQALTIASEIADALDKAHRQGIVHRDLKPANVMLTKAGAKLLDFGLAKLRNAQSPVTLSASADAMTTGVDTARGTILGTVHYMAPEQIEGREADARADIWGLGAVLYEMVTGARPFTGDTPASVIGAILKDHVPDVSARIPATPPLLNRIVARCLAKAPDERWQSAADVRQALLWVKDERPAGQPVAGASSGLSLGRAAVLAALAVVAGAVLIAVAREWRRPPASTVPAEVVRFQLTLPQGLTLVPEQPPAVSPDGRRLALVATDRQSGRRQIYLRSLNSVAAQALGDTLDAQYPFWSPDGTRLAFFSRSRLRVIELASGSVTDVAPAPNPGGHGIWIGDDILHPRSSGPIVRVGLSGRVRIDAQLDLTRQSNQSLVGVLPGGRVLTSTQAGLFLGSIDASSSTLLTDSITMPAALFPPDDAAPDGGWILTFVQNGRLMAQELDVATATLIGQPVVVAQEASTLVTAASRPFSAGGDVLAYISRSDILTRPTWVDRSGKVFGPAASVTGQLRDIRISPDGSRLSVSRLTSEGRVELLLIDLERDTVTPLARDLSIQGATWTADGQALIGVNQQSRERGIYWISTVEGSTPRLLAPPGATIPTAPKLSPDGKHVCFSRYDSTGNFDIFVREMAGSEERPLVSGPGLEASCSVSPDGRWFAYHSNETTAFNIFVRSFPDGQQKQQISLDGGQRPAWRPDGRELYYLAPDGGLMAVAVESATTFKVGTRTRLFTAPVDPSFGTPGVTLFDPARDGQRFVMLVPTSNTPQPVTVILNWRSLLQAQ